MSGEVFGVIEGVLVIGDGGRKHQLPFAQQISKEPLLGWGGAVLEPPPQWGCGRVPSLWGADSPSYRPCGPGQISYLPNFDSLF